MRPWRLWASMVLLLIASSGLLGTWRPQIPPDGGPGPVALPPRVQEAPPPPTAGAAEVTITHPEGMQPELVTAATNRTREAASLLRDKVGWTPGPAPVVELLEQRPTTVADGAVVRIAATDASVPLLLHGMARSAVIARSRGHAPGWLQEGLADYALERAGYAGRQARIDLLRPVGPVPFEQLAKLPAGTVAEPQYERAVATGQLLAVYLEQHNGATAVTALLSGLAQKDAAAALAEASGLALPALEQDFRTWLGHKQRAGDRPVTPPDPTPWMAAYGRPAPPVRTQYQLDLKLDPATFHLTGKQQARITNNEAVPLASLYFHLFPNAPYFATGKRTGALSVQSVRADGQAVPFTGGKDEILGLRLPAPLAPGAAVTLDLAWEATVPDVADRYGVDGPTILLGNFYPILAVHDAGGWHLDRYVAAGDPFYSDVADYAVTFTLPDGYLVAATGHPDAAGRHYTAANVRDFAAAASREWKLYQQDVDGVHLRYYWSKLDQNTVPADTALATAAGALHVYNEQFGPYPYQDLTVVNQQGMEYPQFILAGSVPAVAHEIAHQWWYGVVGNDELRQIWDEGLTEFSSLRYLATAGQERGQLFPTGPLAMDHTLYDYAGRPAQSGSYTRAIYGRGWRLWEALRTSMGGAKFKAMVQGFYTRHQYGNATWADWRDAVSAAGGPTALAVFDAYVYGEGLPANAPGAVAP